MEEAGRREFLKGTLLSGGAVGLGAAVAASAEAAAGSASDEAWSSLEKVKLAMLAMQRRAWEQGVAAQALWELGQRDLVVLLAKDALVNQIKDGRLGLNGDKGPVTDPAANGEPVLRAYEITGDAAFKQAATRMLDFLLYKAPRTRNGHIFHNHVERRIWVDSFYMAPPFLAIAGEPREAARQVAGYWRILFDAKKGACYHMWDDDRQEYARKVLWGVGNGWAAAGMARVIGALPPTMSSQQAEIAGHVRELLDGCLKCRRDDGLFHNVLDDPSTFVETNAAQMFAYSIYRGVRGGWLPRGYLKHADVMRAAAHTRVDQYGLVQGVCGAPNFDRSGTATEGQAFFLLMEAAYRDWAKSAA